MKTTGTSINKLDFLFVMDRMDKIWIPYESSFLLMTEAQRRGHRILYAEPKDLWLAHEKLNVAATIVATDRKVGFRITGKTAFPVEKADCVFIRKDPPFNLEYLYMTYLLETVSGKTLLINSPQALRDFNEKLLPFRFKQWMPPTIVTANPSAILSFQRDLRSDLILKPLNRKGGEGITLLPFRSKRKESAVNLATSNGSKTMLAQKFLKKGLTEGDKRILLWKGEVLGAFGRVPKKSEFRANLSQGGTSKKTSVTKRECAIVSELKPFFLRNGLFLVGLDLVDGMVTEINVTSPAGFYDLTALYGVTLERRVIDSIERMCEKMKKRSSLSD